ncbi:hypothetical protein ACHQM5_018735 [Ranunculus cassubicifolius]
MSVAILDGGTVRKFVKDGDAFNKYVDEHFKILDVNGDGVLSRSELQREFKALLLGNESSTEEEISSFYEFIFERFDVDKNGSVDVEEFRFGMKEIMLAVADGIGDSPIQVALEDGSFLTRALEYEMEEEE